MSVRISEQTIDGPNGNEFRVIAERAIVSVRWCCGDRYEFDEDTLRDAIEHIDSIGSYDDMTLKLTDTNSNSFWVRLDGDGNLHADTTAEVAGLESVPWTDLRFALARALRQLDREAVLS